MYFYSLEKKECSGCTACLHVCPKQCISMKQDEEGFLYPVIDKNSCIKCGLCEKTCPINNPVYKNNKPFVYAAYLKDISQRMKSTSGGAFYAIAKWIIEQNGIVYGAAFDDKFKLKHVGIDSINDLQKLRGSKYLQSDLGDVFPEIKTFLTQGRWVYFVGVGCQVAGLLAFLKKEYKNLITSDLVCHGTPSQLMFDWHLDYLRKKEKGEIISYSFRDLEGWGGCEIYKYISQTNKQGVRRLHGYSLSPYLYSFIKAFNYRYSCYDCKFAKLPRQGDITLADYWGIQCFFKDLDINKGVSLVLLNTSKAHDLWNQVQETFEFRVSRIDDAALKNKNLIQPTTMPDIRPSIYRIIKQRGYKSVAENELRTPHYIREKLKGAIANTLLGKILILCKRHINR